MSQMMVQLIRTESSDHGTFGLMIGDGFMSRTLELPKRNNQPNISCIPAGEYEVVKRYSPSFKKNLYWVKNVKNRSYILIHSANFAGDVKKGLQSHLQGCIALGKRVGSFKNRFGKQQKAVISSRKAVRELSEFTQDKPFTLIIKDMT